MILLLIQLAAAFGAAAFADWHYREERIFGTWVWFGMAVTLFAYALVSMERLMP